MLLIHLWKTWYYQCRYLPQWTETKNHFREWHNSICMKATKIISTASDILRVGFILGVLHACTSSSSPEASSAKLLHLDARDLFEGNWCWSSTVTCGVSSSSSKTSLSITKSTTANEVNLLGLSGVVSGNKVDFSPKSDSFGGIWSGHIERNGSTLSIKFSILYSSTGVMCTNTGTAVLQEDCEK